MASPDARLSRRAFLGTLGIDVAVGLAGCIGGDKGSTGDGYADWPHPHFSSERMGYGPHVTGSVSRPGGSWGIEMNGLELAHPVVFDEAVYLATNERLRAFSAADGTELWSVEGDTQSSFRSSMTVDSERVYVGHSGVRTGVFAYAHDDEEMWYAPTASSIWAPVIRLEPDRGRPHIAGTAGNLYHVRASDGSVEWRGGLFSPVRSFATRDDIVAAGTEGGEVVMLRDEGVERGLIGNW